MSGGHFVRLIPGTTGTVPATSPTVCPGDILQDPTGATPGAWRCEVSGGVQTWVAIASSSAPDQLAFTTASSGAGQLSVTLTTRDAGGNVRPSTPVNFAIAGGAPITPTLTAGSGVMVTGTNDALFFGKSDVLGQVTIGVVGTPADVLNYIASMLTASPGYNQGSTAIP